MEVVYLLLGIGIGLVIGFLLAKLGAKNKNLEAVNGVSPALYESVQQQVLKLEKSVEQKEFDYNDVLKELAKQEQIVKNQKEKLQDKTLELQQMQEQSRLVFENTANRLLEEKSERFTNQNQKNIASILEPLQAKIRDFSEKVEHYYGNENKERSTLQEQIRNLTDLNQQMTTEAQNLTKALKGEAKLQGNWGELLLENILEKSGLRKNFEYFSQSHYQTLDGRHQYPDMVLHLPQNRQVVIDSKMSLTAYERYCSTEDPTAQKKALKEHLTSIKKHIDELSNKKYQQIYQLHSLDFVLMFVPLEAAFLLAVQHDQNLFYKAFEKNVIVVSPMTLLVTVRIIANVWQQENQTKYAQEIARQGGLMYDKFVSFVQDMENVGKRIGSLEEGYNDAMKKLCLGKGNLIDRAEKMREMGVNNAKKLAKKYTEE